MLVVCLGEVLVDCFGDKRIPGGAPANVACHVAALGGKAQLVSGLGDDETGRHLAAWLRERGVFMGLLQTVNGLPTGTVQVLPGPRYEIAAPAAWDHMALTEAARRAAACTGVVVFGTLAQRHPVSRQTIRVLVETARAARVPVLCDLNLRAPFYDEEIILWSLRSCDVLKLNREELGAVARLLAARGSAEELFGGMLREFGIRQGVLTDGENGAWFYEDGRVLHQPAERSGTFSDAVGAGDAVSAVLAVAMARAIPFGKAAAPAAALAAFVVSQPGATPEIPAPLGARLNAMLRA